MKRILLVAALIFVMIVAKANTFPPFTMGDLKMHVDSMPATLVDNNTAPHLLYVDMGANKTPTLYTPASEATDVAKAIKPYKFMDDMTFVGVPIFVAGIIAKGEKRSFRQDYNSRASRARLVTNFHNEIDNYTQFAPMVLSTGLKLAGVEGRSSFGRYLAGGALSYAIMAVIVNPIKYSAKEMRPDGSTRNSWPSGHTATAFVSATILHKEYGLTRSPWYSVAGYGVATATGIMRVLNNRHWISDVLSGAGIGILSTELGYGICDLLFKGKGLKRNDLPDTKNVIDNPSFFSISMGIGLGNRNMNFNELTVVDDNGAESPLRLKFGAATVVGVEGAYFFNKYVGVGGRLRVRSTPIKGWNALSDLVSKSINEETEAFRGDEDFKNMITSPFTSSIESDHITEFSGDIGVYFNYPLSGRFALGAKLLVGRSVMQDLDVDASVAGNAMYLIDENGNEIGTYDDDMVVSDIREGDPYETNWDLVTVSGNNTMKYGTGVSLTYAYKSNFTWKVFVDYDFARKHYTFEYDPFTLYKQSMPAYYNGLIASEGADKISSTIKKNMHNFVIGGSFSISF